MGYHLRKSCEGDTSWIADRCPTPVQLLLPFLALQAAGQMLTKSSVVRHMFEVACVVICVQRALNCPTYTGNAWTGNTQKLKKKKCFLLKTRQDAIFWGNLFQNAGSQLCLRCVCVCACVCVCVCVCVQALLECYLKIIHTLIPPNSHRFPPIRLLPSPKKKQQLYKKRKENDDNKMKLEVIVTKGGHSVSSGIWTSGSSHPADNRDIIQLLPFLA